MGNNLEIYKKLFNIQQELKVPKENNNSYGGFKYRSCEDILELVKPILAKNNLILQLNDELLQLGDRYYIKATATLIDIDTGLSVSTNAQARECLIRPKMDEAQITGAASSYARKYALNGLFCIDDTKDADFFDNSNINTNNMDKNTNTNINNINNAKITATEVAQIMMFCSKKNVEPNRILKKYNVKNLNELTKADFFEIKRVFEDSEKEN